MTPDNNARRPPSELSGIGPYTRLNVQKWQNWTSIVVNCRHFSHIYAQEPSETYLFLDKSETGVESALS